MHITDNKTSFGVAPVVNSNRKEEIVEIFGASGVIISDNGCEFNNSLFFDITEQFNIVLKPTAAESGWSNGIVKRHNAISGKTIDVIIAWFVNVKNSLHICCGYSSNQHVFGHNSSLSFFLVNNLFAMEETSRELLRKHMNVMYDSRKAFTESESNQKLGRAI